jgi:ketosteroid isomerase-like protein
MYRDPAAHHPTTGAGMNDDLTYLTSGNDFPPVTGLPGHGRAVLMKIFNAMDAGDVDAMTSHMTEDVVTRLGNMDEVHGRAAFTTMFNEVGRIVSGLDHQVLGLWHAVEDFDVWIAHLRVTYTLLDASTVTLPACNVFRMRANRVAEYRVYVDLSPVLAQLR